MTGSSSGGESTGAVMGLLEVTSERGSWDWPANCFTLLIWEHAPLTRYPPRPSLSTARYLRIWGFIPNSQGSPLIFTFFTLYCDTKTGMPCGYLLFLCISLPTSFPLLWCQVLIRGTPPPSLLLVNPLAGDWCDQDLRQSAFPDSAPGTWPKPCSSEPEGSHSWDFGLN